MSALAELGALCHQIFDDQIRTRPAERVSKARLSLFTFFRSFVSLGQVEIMTMTSYPSPEETKIVAAAEKLMVETMARYDPSHDAFHGQY